MLDIDWNPGHSKLRQFAGIWIAAFGLLGAALAWKQGHAGSGALIAWAAAAGVGCLGLARPEMVRPVYKAWMAMAFPVGWLLSHVLLGAIFFVVFAGVGLVFRAIGRDPLERRFDRGRPSYWSERPRPRAPAEYFKQF